LLRRSAFLSSPCGESVARGAQPAGGEGKKRTLALDQTAVLAEPIKIGKACSLFPLGRFFLRQALKNNKLEVVGLIDLLIFSGNRIRAIIFQKYQCFIEGRAPLERVYINQLNPPPVFRVPTAALPIWTAFH
jgi:hypothetical protein